MKQLKVLQQIMDMVVSDTLPMEIVQLVIKELEMNVIKSVEGVITLMKNKLKEDYIQKNQKES